MPAGRINPIFVSSATRLMFIALQTLRERRGVKRMT